jgi:type IV pilus assembly protein PilN
MARINLLPWRAERRKLRQKEFATMLGFSAVLAVVIAFLIISYYNAQISGQTARNAFLKDQIAQVDKQIKEIKALDEKKSKLLARKEVIEQLQANRSKMVHLFDSLVRTIPDGVILTSVKQAGDKLTLEGRSQSNARVSTYMRNLEGAGWMTRPELSIIEAKAGNSSLPYTFILTVLLANPNAPKDLDGDGVPDAPVATEASVTDAAAADADATPAPAASTEPASTEPASTEPATEPATEPGDTQQDSADPAPADEPAATVPDAPTEASTDQGENAS